MNVHNCDMEWNDSLFFLDQDLTDSQYSMINTNQEKEDMKSDSITHQLQNNTTSNTIDTFSNDSNNLTFNFDVSNDGQQQFQQQHQNHDLNGYNSGITSWSLPESNVNGNGASRTSDPLIGNTDPGILVPWELLEPDYNQILNNYI